MGKTQEAIDRLAGVVVTISGVAASAAALIGSLAQQIRDSIDDPQELNALADQLEARQAELAAAVTAGTIAEGEPAGEDTNAGGAGEDTVAAGDADADADEVEEEEEEEEEEE